MNRDELAKAIFDWLNRSQDEDGQGKPPYTFNEDADDLTVGVDGYLDCKQMADGIIRKLGLVQTWADIPMDASHSVHRIKGQKTTEVIVPASLGLTINHGIKINTDEPDVGGIYRVVDIRKHNNCDDLVVAAIERVNR